MGDIRELNSAVITETTAELCIKANRVLPCDMRRAIEKAERSEHSASAAAILGIIEQNYRAAEADEMPICQDTGMAVVYIELGQDVHLVGGTLEDAVNAGVREGYARGYLRKSVVADPLRRVNTGDNTPAVLHLELVAGDRVKITLMPKGFGSENMSAVKLFTPSAGEDDICAFVTDAVKRAGGQPCPPTVLGIGIGGTLDKACELSKRALLTPIGARNPDPFYAALEDKILAAVNATGVGPQGMGGGTTSLGVSILTYPTHIAGLPVSLSIGCHVNRRAEATI